MRGERQKGRHQQIAGFRIRQFNPIREEVAWRARPADRGDDCISPSAGKRAMAIA